MQDTIQMLINHLTTAGNYSTLELAACEVTPHTNYYQTMYSDEDHSQYNWYHLLSGSAVLEALGTPHDGSFSGAEAGNERWQAWPTALDVSSTFLRNEAAHRGNKAFDTCSFCTGVAYDFCDQCSRAVCVMHYRQYDGNHKPLCPDHFDVSLNERKKQQRLQQRQRRTQQRSLLPEQP